MCRARLGVCTTTCMSESVQVDAGVKAGCHMMVAAMKMLRSRTGLRLRQEQRQGKKVTGDEKEKVQTQGVKLDLRLT